MSGFLSRWQQRRENVALEEQQAKVAETEEVVEQAASDADVQLAQEQLAQEPEATEEPKTLTAEDLPDPESIEVGGSFASFMADNVDPAAKQAALKALWKQPQYNEIDGLLEYALDYTNQPKLSADVSAELAKKIFRHVVKEEPEEEEQEQLAQQEQGDDLSLAQSEQALPTCDEAIETAENAPLVQPSQTNTTKAMSDNQVEHS
ncbi:DUF3306 domain-containing protein [Shewanella maritima]|uniref:DUF3306 domain-containing protein n=1 Tax=Shewanella maritima TaxID=2520507 RepID=UPI003736B1AE